MIETACNNLRLSGQAKRLMTFYADQADGFTPSLEWIHQNTGLNGKDISKIRQQLVDNCFIHYEANRAIELDWDRIRLYATLDKEMLPTKRGKAFIAPIGSIPTSAMYKRPLKIKQMLRKYKYAEHVTIPVLTPAEERFYRTLENMTEEEVRLLFGGIEPIRESGKPSYMKEADKDDSWSDPQEGRFPHSRDPLPF